MPNLKTKEDCIRASAEVCPLSINFSSNDVMCKPYTIKQEGRLDYDADPTLKIF